MILCEKCEVVEQFLQEEYRELGKPVKCKTRRDKRAHKDAKMMEQAANKGHMRTQHGISKKLSGDFGQSGDSSVKE